MGKNDTPEVRLDQMAEWAAGINEQISDLNRAMIVTTEERADGISLQLSELVTEYATSSDDYSEAITNKTEAALAIAEIKQQLEQIEAPAMLDISMTLVPDGKKLAYTNDTSRKAALIKALEKNEVYHVLLKDLAEQRRIEARAKAIIASIDAEEKRRGRKIDALVARLNNLTARVR